MQERVILYKIFVQHTDSVVTFIEKDMFSNETTTNLMLVGHENM